jgi:hypothetical protein
MRVEIACCGMFHEVFQVPWTCATCGLTHLGAAPPSFLWRVQEHLAALDAQLRLLQEEIVARKHTMKDLEAEQAILNEYLDLMADMEEDE